MNKLWSMRLFVLKTVWVDGFGNPVKSNHPIMSYPGKFKLLILALTISSGRRVRPVSLLWHPVSMNYHSGSIPRNSLPFRFT